MAFAHNVQCLDKRHAGLHHRRHLAGKDSDIPGRDFLLPLAEQIGFLPHTDRINALLAQLHLDQRVVERLHLALDP